MWTVICARYAAGQPAQHEQRLRIREVVGDVVETQEIFAFTSFMLPALIAARSTLAACPVTRTASSRVCTPSFHMSEATYRFTVERVRSSDAAISRWSSLRRSGQGPSALADSKAWGALEGLVGGRSCEAPFRLVAEGFLAIRKQDQTWRTEAGLGRSLSWNQSIAETRFPPIPAKGRRAGGRNRLGRPVEAPVRLPDS